MAEAKKPRPKSATKAVSPEPKADLIDRFVMGELNKRRCDVHVAALDE